MAQNENGDAVHGWKVDAEQITNGSQTIYLNSVTGVEVQGTRWIVAWGGAFLTMILSLIICSWTLDGTGIVEVVVFIALFATGSVVSMNMARERICVTTTGQGRIPLFQADVATLQSFKSRIELAKQSHAAP
jgi:hypothetical protein